MRALVLLSTVALLAGSCPTAPSAPKAAPYCPYVVAVHDSVYVVRGVPVRVIDTVRRCL